MKCKENTVDYLQENCYPKECMPRLCGSPAYLDHNGTIDYADPNAQQICLTDNSNYKGNLTKWKEGPHRLINKGMGQRLYDGEPEEYPITPYNLCMYGFRDTDDSADGINCADIDECDELANDCTNSPPTYYEYFNCPVYEIDCIRSDDSLGRYYGGFKQTTSSGRNCQKWSSQTPHNFDHEKDNYGEETFETNFCRNPDNEPGGPWCYTTDPDTRWEYCGIPTCDDLIQCVNTFGSYTTVCRHGYEKVDDSVEDPDAIVCQDIDECALAIHACGTAAKCINTIASPQFCEDIDECTTVVVADQHLCHVTSTCVNTVGSYNCHCADGNWLNEANCNATDPTRANCVCENINECVATITRPDPPGDLVVEYPMHSCYASSECTDDTSGTYTCNWDCVANFCSDIRAICSRVNIDHSLLDVTDELYDASLVGHYGAQICSCPTGYEDDSYDFEGAPETINCVNINECNTANVCGSGTTDHDTPICVDTDGSYNCYCPHGSAVRDRDADNDGTADVLTIICDVIDECTDTTFYDPGHECFSQSHCTDNIAGTGDPYSCKWECNFDSCNGGTFANPVNGVWCELDSSGVDTCKCPAGYTVQSDSGADFDYLCEDVNECAANPAVCGTSLIDGLIDATTSETLTCHNTIGGYWCDCPLGFEMVEPTDKTILGVHCVDINECVNLHSCTDSHHCLNSIGSYDCLWGCDPSVGSGEYWLNCQQSECKLKVIEENNVQVLRPVCECQEGYRIIETAFDPSSLDPSDNCYCQNSDSAAADYCESWIDVCFKDITGSNNQPCDCSSQFYVNTNSEEASIAVCVDIDECHDDPNRCDPDSNNDFTNTYDSNLLNPTICQNTPGSFVCDCDDGFACTDISTLNACPDSTLCTNYDGSFGCGCSSCDACPSTIQHSECVQSIQSSTRWETVYKHECRCKEGFKLVNGACEDIDECTSSAVSQSTLYTEVCVNTIGSFKCMCAEGYYWDENTQACIDIDECSMTSCLCSQDPVNQPTPSGECNCPSGYERADASDDSLGCIDINECASDGSYECRCPSGYDYDASLNLCIDIHECNLGTHLCHDNGDCDNTAGGYNCACKTGFLDDDTKCIDINECSTDDGGCGTVQVDPNDAALSLDRKCHNTVGSYSCCCPEGYRRDNSIDAKENQCIDINECLEGLYVCDPFATCTNTFGSYECECIHCECDIGLIPTTDENNNTICDDTNECTDGVIAQPCNNNEECYNTAGSYTCICETGYKYDSSSESCLDINECEDVDFPHSCHDRADCTNNLGSYECECPPGTTVFGNGKVCFNETELPCALKCDVCGDNTLCAVNETIGQGECQCLPGFEDFSHCGMLANVGSWPVDLECLDINECDEQPPVICPLPNDLCVNTVSSVTCECDTGYFRNALAECEDINECEDETHLCDNNADCVNCDGDYNCVCRNGYAPDGSGVCIDINECADKALHGCDSLAICENKQGSHTCTCETGWQGDGKFCHEICPPDCGEFGYCFINATSRETSCKCYDGFKMVDDECLDINECEDSTLNDCDSQPGECVNTVGAYLCECPKGYEFQPSTGLCVDVNECDDDLHRCDVNADCVNTEGSYECECVQNAEIGFYLDNGLCLDINECADDTHLCDIEVGICENNVGSYDCECPAGHFGTTGDPLVDCLDINECEDDNNHVCDDKSPVEICANTYGSYTCECPDGYERNNSTGLCDDVDECDLEFDNCDPNANCTNTIGSWECECNSGYHGGSDPVECEDIDECEDLTNCAESICVNTIGSFNCDCPKGFILLRDNCINVNECLVSNDLCHIDADCADNTGSYDCRCKTGFVGNVTQECLDINECDSYFICGTVAECVNVAGSYICNCPDGYENVDGVCIDVNECAYSPCDPVAICANSGGSFSCFCPPGYTGDGTCCICEDVNECTEDINLCHDVAICTNLDVDEFLCKCANGFVDNNGVCEDVNECLESVCGDLFVCSFVCTCKTGYSGSGIACTKDPACGVIDLCDPSALCDDITNDNQELYECSCPPGTEGNGYTECQPSVAICEPSCLNGEICILAEGVSDGVCTCADGYELINGICTDINECSTIGCTDNMDCMNLEGSYQCLCASGSAPVQLSNGQVSCGNVNECEEENMCSKNAKCIDMNIETDGIPFKCECLKGYYGTGETCCDTDECGDELDECDENAICRNTEGSYECFCKEGYEGSGSDPLECEDIDECTEETHRCDINGICLNTDGSFVCDGCIDPFFGTGYQVDTCEDINECDVDPTICGENIACCNLYGSFVCVCPCGYEYVEETQSCIDIDECATGDHACDESQNCFNQDGYHECACRPEDCGVVLANKRIEMRLPCVKPEPYQP
ncbi:unnamed protein product [Oikopleura dioica]|uniref:Uncharacterized protein n=1 Tax=Oikopleura dioica TaxID=34765 RepID=E4YDV6_OIKDI|nr:unnamed protein product [Oikopleura dioica]